MNKCGHCGRENAETAYCCDGCGTELRAQPPFLSPSTPPPVPAFVPSAGTGLEAADRRLRFFELILVCSIAFGGAIIVSLDVLVFGSPGAPIVQGVAKWTYGIFRELAALCLLWYVLRRRAKRLSDLGLRWRRWEAGYALLLWATGLAAVTVSYLSLRAALASLGFSAVGKLAGERILFGGGVSTATFLFQLVNPFFEELIVRAYVITEVRDLSHSVVLAVAASVVLQVSYHLYQGLPAALSYVPLFLIFSVYYVRTNRIWAPILAHLIFDVMAAVHFWLWPLGK